MTDNTYYIVRNGPDIFNILEVVGNIENGKFIPKDPTATYKDCGLFKKKYHALARVKKNLINKIKLNREDGLETEFTQLILSDVNRQLNTINLF